MMKKSLSIILLVFWMSLIFYFSHQNSSESSSLSNGFLAYIYTFITGNEASSEILGKYSFFIRKLAHFSIYFVLGLLSFNVMFQFNVKYKYGFAFIISFLYSVSDEIHQTFVNGRAGQVMDVLIDSSGALLAILICYIVCKKFCKREKI